MVTEAGRQHVLLLTLCIAALAWLVYNPATDIYAVPGAKTTTRAKASKARGSDR